MGNTRKTKILPDYLYVGKTRKIQKTKIPDIGTFGAYMFVDHRKRVMVFYYGKMPNSDMYKYAFFDNFVDGPGDADKHALKAILAQLFQKYKMYSGLTHTPEEIHELIKDKVSNFYSLNWIKKNYSIVGNDLHNSGFL